MSHQLGLHWIKQHQTQRDLDHVAVAQMREMGYNTGVVNQKSGRSDAGNILRPEQVLTGELTMDHSTPQPLFPKIAAASCGVYRIFNTANGKKYIGSSQDIAKRLAWHVGLLDRGAHPNRHLQAAWNKYGRDAFLCEVVEVVDLDNQYVREQFYIDTEQPEYNLTTNATGGPGIVSESTRQKHTQNNLRRWSDPEYKERLSNKFVEVNADPEVKRRKSEAGKRRMASAEARAAASERAKQQWADPEHRKRVSEANKGTPPSDNARAAVAKANSNRVWTEEARQKVAEASRRAWEKRRAQ